MYIQDVYFDHSVICVLISYWVPVGNWYCPIPKRPKPWKGKGPWHEKLVNYEEIAIELRQRDHAFDQESRDRILKRHIPEPGQVIKVDLPERVRLTS